MSNNEVDELSYPITVKEISKTNKLGCLEIINHQGQMDFPVNFIIFYFEQLTPALCEVFDYALSESDPPKSWPEVIVSVIHKEGKEPITLNV